MISGEDAGGPVTAALNLQEHQDSTWLDIDHFPDSDLGFENSAAEDECQRMGNIEDKSESNRAKDGQAEDGSQEMDHNVVGAWDKDEVGHGGEDAIADPEMDGIGVDGEGSHGKDSYRARVGGDAEG